MPHLRITITHFINAHQPGWVACELTDAQGAVHVFHEKVPVVTQMPLGENSSYPQEGVIACTLLSSYTDAAGNNIVTVNTATPWAIESIEGTTHFEVFASQLTDVG